MVTSTRAIVNTARSMVSTIMKFLDSGPGKASDGNLKARVMTSEPDNAEGLHNFAPLGIFDISYHTLIHSNAMVQCWMYNDHQIVPFQAPSHPAAPQHSRQRFYSRPRLRTAVLALLPGPTSFCRRRPGVISLSTFLLLCY